MNLNGPCGQTICPSNFDRAREPRCTKLVPICAKNVLGVTYMPTAASSYVTSGGLSLHPFDKRKLMKKKIDSIDTVTDARRQEYM